MSDLTFAAITAPLDERLSPNERHVMALLADWPQRGGVTLDALCRRTSLPRPYVFAAVARLEDLGYLPIGVIR